MNKNRDLRSAVVFDLKRYAEKRNAEGAPRAAPNTFKACAENRKVLYMIGHDLNDACRSTTSLQQVPISPAL